MSSSLMKGDKEFVRVSIEYNKQKLKFKFPTDTKILHLEEFIKRTVKATPIEAVYLFRKDQRQLMVPAKTIV